MAAGLLGIARDELIELEELSAGAPERPPLPPAGAMTLEEMERAMVVRALAAAARNVTSAGRREPRRRPPPGAP